MKFIFSFLFCIILLSPALADNTNQCTGVSPQNNCDRIPGCYYDDEDGCQRCALNKYSTASMTVCGSCTDSSDDNYFSYPDHASFDSANQTLGQGSCPWICDAGYYRGGANNDSCQECPEHSTNCNANGSSGLTYDTVQCDTDSHRVRNSNTHTVNCIQCPEHALWYSGGGYCYCGEGYFWNNDKTECIACPTSNDNELYNGDSDYISDCTLHNTFSCGNLDLIKTPNNKYYCGTCFGQASPTATIVECDCTSAWANNRGNVTQIPANKQQCVCPNGAGSGNGDYANKCVCNTSPGTILKQSSDNSFSCASCSDIVSNSTLVGANNSTSVVYTDGGPNACVCDLGYYKQGSNQCANCPIGLTTTDSGATSRNACQMPKTVKLCLVNNTNRTTSNATQCMQPIPQSANMTDMWPNN